MKTTPVREYLHGWKWGRLENMFKQNNSAFFLVVYFPLMLLVAGALCGEDFTVADMVMELGLTLPFVLVWCSMMLHPVRLSKMYYLCPQTAAEREKMVIHSYCFRFGVHMFLFCIGFVFVFGAGTFRLESLILLLLNAVLVSSFIPVGVQAAGAYYRQLFLTPVIMITDLAQLALISDTQSQPVIQIILYAVFFLIELPLYIGIFKYTRKELQAAAVFEEESA
ncbi:MAG: hypothetical protein ACI4SA_02085 [Lachnospiraceae bacterium]